MRFLERRRMRKKAQAVSQAASLARNMREDVAPRADLDRLDAAERAMKEALKGGSAKAFEKAAEEAMEAVHAVYPEPRHPVAREWVELIVVALAVAMGFRTYLLQPFKIPTGSMQPTLYGIHFKPDTAPPVFRDVAPLKMLRLFVMGEQPFEVRAESAGRIYPDPTQHPMSTELAWIVGNRRYVFSKDLRRHAKPGERVIAGQLLASGVKVAGDHLFVNRMAWNFRRPRVGEIMVFSTEKMLDVTPDTHYIKRMVGTPGDRLRIDSPMLYVNDVPMDTNPDLRKVVTRKPGYEFGYQNGRLLPEVRYLKSAEDVYTVPAGHYFGIGDNTMNSRDSRYFGPIPEEKLMGPALFVYWPFSLSRWGFIRP